MTWMFMKDILCFTVTESDHWPELLTGAGSDTGPEEEEVPILLGVQTHRGQANIVSPLYCVSVDS